MDPHELASSALELVDGATDKTLHSIQIEVIPNQVTLIFPAEVSAGSVFEVTWTGPDGSRDFVTVVPEGAAEGTYLSYFYTNAGPTGSLVAPPDAGTYEIRYVGGSSNATFHSQPITVTPFDITLQAPAEVDKGAEFEVTWTGPNGPGDYVTIVLVGAAPGSYGDWAYVTEGNPVKLTAPTTPGDYEIRYQADRVPNRVFHSIPIKVR